MKRVKSNVLALFVLSFIVINLFVNFSINKGLDTKLGFIAQQSHADGESGGGWQRCYFNTQTGLPKIGLICTSQYDCYYSMALSDFYDECWY